MPREAHAPLAVVGVADHAGWAVLITATGEGSLLDRRRVALVAEDLPKLPHHHEAQALPLPEAEALIGRVQASTASHARACLDALARETATPIHGIAIRACPALPETVAARISDYRAQCVADTVMVRRALAEAAAARGWRVHAYDPKHVFVRAAEALERESITDRLAEVGAAVGPPWRKDHRMAMAAAIAAAGAWRS